MNVFESSIEQELERLGTENVTLSELRLAITRLQESEPNQRDKVRKTRDFLGMLAERLELPGLFTLPNGRHFVYKQGDRYVTKSALPEYMTAEEVRPLAQRNLIPQEAATALADLINTPETPNEFRYGPDGEMIPADSAEAQTQRDAEAAAAAAATPAAPAAAAAAAPAAAGTTGADTADPSVATEPAPAATGGSALTRFASSGKGGLRNDPDETEAITELQTFLVNELGLDTGGTDGRYGPKTRAAVRRFQSALTDVVQDGDAGPETIGKISEIRTDMARIQELVGILNDSVIPVVFKSGLAQLLERQLTQQERTELEQLVSKYRNFRQDFPRFQGELFSRADQAITGEVSRPGAAAEGPFLDGMVITPDIQERLEALGRDRGMVGERLTAEDIAALNAGVANGTITAPPEVVPDAPAQPPIPGAPEVRSAASTVADPQNTGVTDDPEAQTFVQDNPTAIRQIRTAIRGPATDEPTIFRVMSTIRNQQQWDQLQQEYQRQYRKDLVDDLIGDLGGFSNDINSTDMVRYVWDPLGRANIDQGSRINQTNPAAPAAAPAADDAVRRVDDRTLDLINRAR